MTLSAELEQRYSTEVDVDWWEGLVLSHSLFPQTYYLTSLPDRRYAVFDAGYRWFEPVPFEVAMPRRDDGGRGDVGISIGAIGNEISQAIRAALEDPNERIRARYTVYIDGDPNPQRTPPVELSLMDIVQTERQVSGVAVPSDSINAPFPSTLYRTDTFPGLARR